MQEMKARPPYLTFETRSVEDREASIKEGRYVGKDVDFVLITPAGSKDRIERLVSEWLPQTRIEVEAERLPREWAEHYAAAYRAFKEGQELAVVGTPIQNWPGLSPTQFKTLQSLHIRAVEDLAQANAETISRLGMGGNQLKQRAIEFLAASKDVGKVAEEAAELRFKLEASQKREKELTELVQNMGARLDSLEKTNMAGGEPRPDSMTAAIQASDFIDTDEPPARRPL